MKLELKKVTQPPKKSSCYLSACDPWPCNPDDCIPSGSCSPDDWSCVPEGLGEPPPDNGDDDD